MEQSDAVRPDQNPSVLVRCWGCRGSIPSPGPATAGYGGNTSCVEIRAKGKRIILDAGSGLRLLGQQIMRNPDPLLHIFLTHFHWDHIQGFPFFTPLYVPEIRLDIYAPRQLIPTRNLFAGQMGPIYFPVPFETVAADVEFHDFSDGWEEGGFSIKSYRMRHPSHTLGYRIEVEGRSICYIPDNEVRGRMYLDEEGWRDGLVEFASGADVLFHDAFYTEREYPNYVGWGHSTYRDALDVALDAGVDQLFFFHHSPDRTDRTLNEILAEFRAEVEREGHPLELHAAFEGKQIIFE